eukprot:14757736-Alexandrium_andersonii.AAC.1
MEVLGGGGARVGAGRVQAPRRMPSAPPHRATTTTTCRHLRHSRVATGALTGPTGATASRAGGPSRPPGSTGASSEARGIGMSPGP